MIDYKEFGEKIKSMSAHDIIMAMVVGLRNPKTKIDMSSFGEMRDGICFGCAATNAILHIINANEEQVKSHVAYIDNYDDSPLRSFECAIDYLRLGRPEFYNENAKRHGFAQITPMPGQELPVLYNNYTEKQLREYEKLAEYNRKVESIIYEYASKLPDTLTIKNKTK